MTYASELSEAHWAPRHDQPLADLTIGELMRHAARRAPEQVAFVWAPPEPAQRRSWTNQQMLDDAERLAHALLEGFEPGERVAIWSPNSAGYVLLQRGLALAGLVLVPIDPAYQFSELEYVLTQSGAVGLLYASDYRGRDLAALAAKAARSLPRLHFTAELDPWVADVVSNVDASRATPLPTVGALDPFQIQYTSGTTGFPKGALLHHKGVLNMARFVADRSDILEGDVWVNAMPLFHIAGGVTTELVMLARVGTYVLMPGFDAGLLLELIETYRATITLAVPTMLIAMLEHPDFDRRNRTSLRTVMSGAATVNSELVVRTRERFGCGFTNVYGQTEMHGIVTQTLLDDSPQDQASTIGPPLPHVEIAIFDPATDQVCPLDVAGEIRTRGYTTMIGYYGMPEATAAAVDVDGWLHSGDLGAMDARGYVTITGKLKDLVIRGGEKIYPREIEELLFTHPAVADVAVIGVPDDRWGEQVAAVVRAVGPGLEPDPAELAAFCRERLARYKTPKYWYLVEAFPLTASGKIRKVELAEQVRRGELGPATEAP
ncbi:MAG: AMP-dependent synthetase [Pseudonocardia sp. SCN 72-86]|nr:MAG: AMP-dependent synthetase [Pseudonocardia sp. SCN 72-86]